MKNLMALILIKGSEKYKNLDKAVNYINSCKNQLIFPDKTELLDFIIKVDKDSKVHINKLSLFSDIFKSIKNLIGR